MWAAKCCKCNSSELKSLILLGCVVIPGWKSDWGISDLTTHLYMSATSPGERPVGACGSWEMLSAIIRHDLQFIVTGFSESVT